MADDWDAKLAKAARDWEEADRKRAEELERLKKENEEREKKNK